MVDSAEKVKGRNEMALARINKKYNKEVENAIMRSGGRKLKMSWNGRVM